MENNQTEKKKSDELNDLTDTLLVHDKETNKILAVKGMKRKNGKQDGELDELETIAPIKRNQNSFLKLNKNEDMLSNFLKNFFSQISDPTRFNFFKVPIEQVAALAKKMQQFIDTAKVEGNDLLNGLKEILNPPNIKDTMAQKQQQQETPKKSNTYSVDKIDWSSLEELGWTREDFAKTNLLDSLLKGYKTKDLLPISLSIGNTEIETEAKFWLETETDGRVVFKILPKKNEIEFNKKFYGHEFSEDDKANLLEKGHMGRAVNLTTEDNVQVPHLITLDKETKQLVSFPVSEIRIDDIIKGITLSPEQKNTLLEGKPIYLEGMLSKNDSSFNGEIQFNAFKGHIEFQFPKKQEKAEKHDQSQNENSQNEPKEIPKIFRRKEFTVDQYNRISNGETVYIADFKDAAGKAYPGYVKLNKESGELKFSFPNQHKEKATPAESHKTQVEVNSNGKTNEATKNIKEPLNSGQTGPRNEKQQNSQKESNNNSKKRGRRIS